VWNYTTSQNTQSMKNLDKRIQSDFRTLTQ